MKYLSPKLDIVADIIHPHTVQIIVYFFDVWLSSGVFWGGALTFLMCACLPGYSGAGR